MKPINLSRSRIAAAVGTVIASTMVAPVHAACVVTGTTYVVDTASDVIDAGDGLTTLREAVALANANPDCDNITFSPALNGQTITLDAVSAGASRISINEDTNVIGPGSGLLTITDPVNASSFWVMNTSGGDFDISGITFDGLNDSRSGIGSTGANLLIMDDVVVQNMRVAAGGGSPGFYLSGANEVMISNSRIINNADNGIFMSGGTLTLDNVTVSQNSSTGIRHFSNSNVANMITNSVIADNEGGGIDYSSGTDTSLLINETRISGNTVSFGGAGIELGLGQNNSAVTITNSTISGNSSSTPLNESQIQAGSGAGIKVNNAFTAMSPDSYTLTIAQSTISGNTATGAGGGIYIGNRSATSTINIVHSTITNNTAEYGGGVFSNSSGGDINISNTVIAGNTSNLDVFEDVGSAWMQGTAGDMVADYSFVGAHDTNVTDAGTGSQLNAGDPMLAALADGAGSGTTETHMPMAGSMLIDMGDPALTAGTGTTPATDQDGRTRVIDARIDIGAVESGIDPNAPVDLGDDSGGGGGSGGSSSPLLMIWMAALFGLLRFRQKR